MKGSKDSCSMPRCKQPVCLIHLGKPLCWKHWEQKCKSEEKELEAPCSK